MAANDIKMNEGSLSEGIKKRAIENIDIRLWKKATRSTEEEPLNQNGGVYTTKMVENNKL